MFQRAHDLCGCCDCLSRQSIQSERGALREGGAHYGERARIRVPVLNASTEHDLDEVSLPWGRSAVILTVPAEPFFDSQRDRIVALAMRYAVPMIAGLREYVAAGDL